MEEERRNGLQRSSDPLVQAWTMLVSMTSGVHLTFERHNHYNPKYMIMLVIIIIFSIYPPLVE